MIDINGQDLANNAAGQASKPTGKMARKALSKGMKALKKVTRDFIKRIIATVGKSLLTTLLPYILLGVLVVIIVQVVISAIPFADWFLGGGSRSEAQIEADYEYEEEFKLAADKTVAEIAGIEASESWKTQLMNTLKPSWGIPVALVRYKIIVEDKKIELTDYDPDKIIAVFKPQFSYTTISDDTEWTKSVKSCTTTDDKGNSNTTTTTSTSSRKMASHKVLSKATLLYGDMNIKSIKKYYPGGSTSDSDQWEQSGTSTSNKCTTTTYTKYERTTVDDRFVPVLNINSDQFQNIFIHQGVKKEDMKLLYTFIQTADPNWNPSLYGGSSDSISGGFGFIPGTAKVSDAVLRYEPLVRKYAKIYKVEPQVNLILALIQQESSGTLPDVMQSSESANLPPNTFTDPEVSIAHGVKHFAECFTLAKGDVKIALQAYNFGKAFALHALEHGGYSKELAISYSKYYADKYGWKSYGDVNYVDHVLRYYSEGLTLNSDGQIFDVQKALDLMTPYLGWRYVWDGKRPEQGGFDCSGLISYTFAQLGIDLSGNAETQFKKTVAVNESDARPGDLVFWSTYKAAASHVGMYLGDDKFINSNDSGLKISSVSVWNKENPFLGFRRIVK